jgi:hypothetical protein
MSELRTLLERFANGASMDGVFDASNALIDDARRDEEFRNWFHRLNTYIRKVGVICGHDTICLLRRHRFYLRLALYWKMIATVRVTRFSSQVVNSGTRSIKSISTTSSMPLANGFQRWEKIP